MVLRPDTSFPNIAAAQRYCQYFCMYQNRQANILFTSYCLCDRRYFVVLIYYGVVYADTTSQRHIVLFELPCFHKYCANVV